MRLLIDTQIYYWTSTAPHRLPRRARELMEEADQVYVSAASIWELVIKIGVGKLEGDARRLVEAIAEGDFLELAVSARHGAAVRDLPMHHKDPFDRILVAQAIAEALQLVTADELLGLYSDQVIVV